MANKFITPEQFAKEILDAIRKKSAETGISEVEIANELGRYMFTLPYAR